MICAVICDDEKAALNIIRHYIEMKKLPIEIAGTAESGRDALELSYLYTHYQEQIDLKTLSGICYCTESHLARVFKRETGLTVISYVHKIRVEKSLKLMEEGGMTIKEAAEEVGYQNLNQFYKYFEAQLGMTPAAWLKDNHVSVS